METYIFILFVMVYFYTGFSLKLLDQINDENFSVNNKLKFCILISSPFLASIVMALDLYNASVGLMLIFGLFLSKKVNVTDFKFYAIITIGSMTLMSFINQFYVFVNFVSILPTTLILLLAVISDEIINEFLDKHPFKNSIVRNLASIRPILKIIAFSLPLFNLFTWYHAFQVLSLDIAYDLTKYCTERKMKLQEG
ncbi:MAG: hypothetical protein ACTSRS_11975 [Candidatus Helarchaeota archaeon]